MTIEEAVGMLIDVAEDDSAAEPPTREQIDQAEEQLGMKFPEDYRYFLQHASHLNFGMLEPAMVNCPEEWPSLASVAEEGWSLGLPREWLPFCEDNSDYYCLTPQGNVRFWSHNGTTDESWPNLATWISECWIGELLEDD